MVRTEYVTKGATNADWDSEMPPMKAYVVDGVPGKKFVRT